MPGPLPFPGFAGLSGRRLHPSPRSGQALLLSLPLSRPGTPERPHPSQAVGASVGSVLPVPAPVTPPTVSSLFPRLLPWPGPRLGLSKVSGLSRECVCSVKMHQIHDLEPSEGWLMSAKAVEVAHSAPRPALSPKAACWPGHSSGSLLGRLSVKLSFSALVPTVWTAGPVSPTRRAPSPGSAWSWLWTCRACPAPGSAPHPSGSDSVSGRREAV